ncbi:MAG TPA: tetratricopeptide repeat protein [Verrucomicrobiae bacterium]|nr:tetratricopeptide repeat protein [Verrucomicrobiae bacterium]
MIQLRRWFLILSALILGGGQVFAANAKEQRAFTNAVAAFHFELWGRAENEFTNFVQQYPASTNVPQAVLYAAEAEYKLGDFTNAIARLTERKNVARAGALADQYVYWTGEAQFAAGDFADASETFASLVKDFPVSPLRTRAIVEQASALAQTGQWPEIISLLGETNGVFQHAAQLDPDNELVSRGRLLQAQSYFNQNDFTSESAVLSLINPQLLSPDLDTGRERLNYQLDLATSNLPAALTATTNLSQIARRADDENLRAESLALRADVLEKMGRLNDAIDEYQNNLTNSAPVGRQRQAILKIAELAAAQNQFSLAETNLEVFLSRFTNSPAADVALLSLGELHLKQHVAQSAETNHLAVADALFGQFITTFTNSPLLGKAFLDRGWCEWLAQDTTDSLADFETAAGLLPSSEDLAVAKFKIGDALLKENDFADALTNYRAVLDDFTNFPDVLQTLGGPALSQSLRAELALGDLAGASNTLAQITENDSTGESAQTTAFLLGERLLDLHSPAGARAEFEKIAAEFPDSPLRPQLELAVAQTYEAEQDWTNAIGQYEGWLTNYPASPLWPQADYALAQANYQAGDGTNAFNLFTNFVMRYPTNELAPLAQWWVADHFYRAGDFVNAEKNYKIIFQNPAWQNSSLFYQAQLMAERAAVGWGGTTDATNYFSALVTDTNCPPDLSAQARFVWGGALMQMPAADTNNPEANFQQATNFFGQIIQSYPTNGLGLLAWGEIGDCNLQMNNFATATNAYAQVFNSPFADISARSQAQIGFGIALEKMAATAAGDDRTALLKLAQQNYLDVFFGTNRRDDELQSAFWTKEAGLRALALIETLGTGDPDKFINNMENWFPESKDSLEKIRAGLQKN